MSRLQPIVSVCCLTYNHAKYIERALKSILDQKTNFIFELIVHDDASTDGTTEIVKQFAKDYPDIVKQVIQQQNLLSSGTGIYSIYTEIVLTLAKGKYIAICEGDDYWTDPNKLQQQVDYLESHPECSLCFHKVGILKNGETNNDIYEAYHKNILGGREGFEFIDLLKDNIIPNCSVVYRNTIRDFPALFGNLIFPDWPLHLLYAEKGKLGYINKFMAVHHDHEKGMWNGSTDVQRTKSIISFYIDLLGYLGETYHPVIYESLERYTRGFQPSDFGKDFEVAYAFGAIQKQKEINQLQRDLDTIFKSGSWKLANKLSRIIKYFTK